MNTKKSTVKVIETNQRPPEGQGYMMIMNGIGTKEAAARWGAKYGFATVYFNKRQEKVYGVQSIAEDAQELEARSAALVQLAEVTE